MKDLAMQIEANIKLWGELYIGYQQW
jgi:hypothetical protein